MNLKIKYAGIDILQLLESPLIVFYEYKVDDGELLKLAADEIKSLRAWQEAAFEVDPNIDLAVEKFL